MDKTSTADQAPLAEAQARSTHTPGPWKVWTSRVDNTVNVSAAKDSAFVCKVGALGEEPALPEHDQNINADARLIAAAPDLLAALDAIVITANKNANASPSVAAFNLAFDAIKKARG